MKTYNSTKGQILSVVVPQQTRTYKPVSNQQLIDLTLQGIESNGFKLDKELYSLGRQGNVSTGRYSISNVADSEMQLQIAWQNSYDKSVTLKFAIGTHILVCSNGCVSGSHGAFKKKHMGEVQSFTPNAIKEYISSAGEAFKQLQHQREIMKQHDLTKRTCAELIGRMYIEEAFINDSQMNIIKRELSNPSHDYGAPGSVWELYNYTTFALKGTHPSYYMDSHLDAHKFFTSLCPELEVKEKTYTQLEMFV